MVVHYSARSFDDLENIRSRFIEYGLPESGERTIAAIIKTCDLLSTFPLMGVNRSEALGYEGSLRFVKCKRFLIFYEVEADDPYVLRILDERMDCLSILSKGMR